MNLNEMIYYFKDMVVDGKYNQVIDEIGDLLSSNPSFLNENYLSFSNLLEKAIYEKYFELSEEKIVFDEFNLEELFITYGISFLYAGDLDNAEKFLKIANRINPVSTPALKYLCDIYIRKNDLVNAKDAINKIFKFNYYPDILFSNYLNLSKISPGDPKIYASAYIFRVCLNLMGYDESLEKSLIYLNNLGIQIGYNPEVIEISKDVCNDASSDDSTESFDYDGIYQHMYNFNSYYKGLSLDENLDGIIEEVKISIANNEIDDAISKIKCFLENDSLDNSFNYKFFDDEIGRKFYFDSPDFDCNFILLPKHKNYYYLYYLYGFCLDKKKKYKDSVNQFKKALGFNPYAIFIHFKLLNVKFDHNIPVSIDELVYLADICYRKDDLLRIYSMFSRYFMSNGNREDGELIDTFVTHLIIDDFKDINLNAVRLLNDYGFPLGFNQFAINCLKEIVDDYSKNKTENLDIYEDYMNQCITLNGKLDKFRDLSVDLDETRLLKDFSEDELVGSFVLIDDKLSEEYYPQIDTFRYDFDEREFDLSDSFVCYCYRQVTGSLAFLLLTVCLNNDELTIYTRNYFVNDVILFRGMLENEKATLINDLSQFDYYIAESDNYSKWIGRNISGNEEIDKEFLLNELKNVEDDPFHTKKDAIGNELKKLINPKDLLKKEVPCEECINQAKSFIQNGEYGDALVYIDEFLNEYPPLYFDGYMSKYVYFDDLERKIYVEYEQTSKRLINLPKSQNYCEIFNLKAQTLMYLGRYDEAVDYTDYCLKLNPLNVKASIILSQIYAKQDDFEFSKHVLKNALLFNRELQTHIEIYDMMVEACLKLNENTLANNLSKLSGMLNDLNFDDEVISDIKESIISDDILFGFNNDMILDNQNLLKLNEKLHNGTSIDNILQQTKPLIDKWGRVAYEKLGLFMRENASICGYEIPYDKFDASLMYGDNTDGDVYFNFENNMDYEIFKEFYPDVEVLKTIPSEYKVCELLNTYAFALKFFFAGKSKEVLKESIKLNSVNSKTYWTLADVCLSMNRLDDAKEAFDNLFKYCWDKKILIRAYVSLSEYYQYRGLSEVSKVLKEFVLNVKNNSFENKGYIEVFKNYDIQLGFNEEIMEIIKDIDDDLFEEMKAFNLTLGN